MSNNIFGHIFKARSLAYGTDEAKELQEFRNIINEEIDKYEAGLEALQEAEQNAYGAEYAENLNKQLDLIKKLKEAQEERLEIAKRQES